VKIVQSFWSKPFLLKKKDNWEGRKSGGWSNARYYYMSCALSCLLLKKYYSEIELITDQTGAQLLIGELKLPYTHTLLALDTLNHYPEDLWAIGKLYTYSIQTTPFLHVDNDVFVWQKFDDRILKGELVSQNIEINFKHDVIVLKEIFEQFSYIPEEIKNNPPWETVVSCNAGVFGGNDLSFFNKYTTASFDFINNNREKLASVNTGLANIIFEQYLFACMARKSNIPVTYVLEQLNHFNDYGVLIDYANVPHRNKYIHIIGPFKKRAASEEWLEERLRLEFPEYYYRILELCENLIL
jgi:hypothetical protein